MNRYLENRINSKGAALFIFIIFFLFAAVALVFIIARGVYAEFAEYNALNESKASYFVAEALAEDVSYRNVVGMDVDDVEVLSLRGSVATATASSSVNIKEIYVEGDKSDLNRNIRTRLINGSTVYAFGYGVQVGNGGLDLASNAVINGDAHSNGDITGSANSRIEGDASAVGTISDPNPSADSKTEGASVESMPEIDIQHWRDEAALGGTHSGDYDLTNSTVDYGPMKIDGNFTLDTNAVMNVTGVLHVTGNMEMKSNSIMNLDTDFGSMGTVIIVDGTITFNSNADVNSTGESPDGYILFVSSSTDPVRAIRLETSSGDAVTGAVYAPYGAVEVTSNAETVAIAGNQVNLASGVEINWSIDIGNAQFIEVPDDSFIMFGWREIE